MNDPAHTDSQPDDQGLFEEEEEKNAGDAL